MRLLSLSRRTAGSAKCPTCGGHVINKPWGELYAGYCIRDGVRVEIWQPPAPAYRDPVVVDEITQVFEGRIYRIWPSEHYYKNQSYLHRDAWECAFGPIPRDCHIHHRDENVANNHIENLECIPKLEHLRHTAARRIAKGTHPHPSKKARDAAAGWHRSEEGRLWHSRHAKRTKSWTKWRRELKPCAFCGKEFMALVRKQGHPQKYCSNNRKSAAFRERRPDYYRGRHSQ